jgi:uncharacterized membrane protein
LCFLATMERISLHGNILIIKRDISLDILRGVAAVLMIQNHVGVSIPTDQIHGLSILKVLIEVGSYAPVIFFFLTGCSSVLNDKATFHTVFRRASLLILADQGFFWPKDVGFGIDFLGFIGISSLICFAITRSKFPITIACFVGALIVTIRYGSGLLLRDMIPDIEVLNWIVGISGRSWSSYPMSPWLFFPLLGIVWQKFHLATRSPLKEDFFLAVSGVGFVIFASCLFANGWVWFRWGTVSAAFFVSSVGVLALMLWLSIGLTKIGRGNLSKLKLDGNAAFMIVPVHYFLIALLTYCGIRFDQLLSYIFLVGLVGGISFFLAKTLSQYLKSSVFGPTQTVATVMLAFICCLTIYVSNPLTAPLQALIVTAMQISIGVLVANTKNLGLR